MRLPIALIAAAVFAVALLVSVAMWLVPDRDQPAEEQAIPPTPPQFDTTGGQEMRPRWNDQEGASDGTP